MSFETYDIYFSGKLLKDQDPALVQQKIGALFKLEGERLQQLFSGKPVVIKKGVDMDEAAKYRVAFRKAGALVEITPTAGSAVHAPSPKQPKAAEKETADLTLSAAEDYDLSDCMPLVEPQEIPDVDYMAIDQPGVIIDETPPPEPLEIDTQDLELDKPGVILDPTPTQPEATIDTADLQLSPPDPGSMEHLLKSVKPAPVPNIDHLDLAQEDSPSEGKARFKPAED